MLLSMRFYKLAFLQAFSLKKIFDPPCTSEFLSGVYKPVSKESTASCKIIGDIPDELKDTFFIRNGPNPKFNPSGGHHFFDGDSMFHSMYINKDMNEAIYHNRYIYTRKLKEEISFGHQIFVNIGDLETKFGIVKLVYSMLWRFFNRISSFESTANTSIIYHHKKLLALGESGFPYELYIDSDNVISTKGVYTFSGKLTKPFTAHPKVDPVNGHMYGISNFYIMGDKPVVKMIFVDDKGVLYKEFDVKIRKPIVMHDFSITNTNIILLDLPMVYDISRILKNKFPVKIDDMKPRIGIVKKSALSDKDTRWFDIDDHFVSFHTVNSWEETNKYGELIIHLVTCDMTDNISLGVDLNGNRPIPYKTIINTVSGEVKRICLGNEIGQEESLDFPMIRPHDIGREIEYAFFIGHVNGKPVSIVKLDLNNGKVLKRLDFIDGIFCGECGYDKYLTTFVTIGDLSEFHIYNEDLELISKIEIPFRIPIGFHTHSFRVEN